MSDSIGNPGFLREAQEFIVAVLHDALEDSPLSAERLLELGFPEPIVAALRLLTKPKGQAVDYDVYIVNLAENRLARRVKLLDLKDNMNLDELPVVEAYHLKRLGKYLRAHRYLVNVEEGGKA